MVGLSALKVTAGVLALAAVATAQFNNVTSLYGTWTSGTGAVVTGPVRLPLHHRGGTAGALEGWTVHSVCARDLLERNPPGGRADADSDRSEGSDFTPLQPRRAGAHRGCKETVQKV